MPIPRGLVIYKASRYQESYPFHLKHRCYPDKILLSTEVPKPDQKRIYSWRYQPKITNITKVPKVVRMTQKLSLYLEADSQKNTQIMRYFPKLKNVKKCFIHFHKGTESFSKEVDCCLAEEMILQVFKTLKQLEQVELNELGPLQKDCHIFKSLILQRSLQKLTLIDLKYTNTPKDLEPFLNLSRSVSKRKCWPHLKHLKIDLAPSEEKIPHCIDRLESTGTLKNLLQFLQDFKSCRFFYKLSHLQLRFPDQENPNCKEAAALDKILKMQLPIDHICSWQSKQISKIFDLTEHSQNLQSLSLKLHDDLDDYLDTSPLEEFPSLQEFKLQIYCSDEDDDESPEVYFYYFAIEQIQNMTNLRSLSLDFDGDRGDVQAEFPSKLAELSELTYLKLRFGGFLEDEGTFIEVDRSWLGETFQEISKKKKLKELALDIQTFDFPDSTRTFKIFCQSLGKLTKLTSLHFRIEFADAIKDQDVAILVPYLNTLKKLESLSLHIGGSHYKSSTFILLLDSIMTNFPFLSDLNLELHSFDVTKQCYQLIYKAIHQMKCLNKMDILIRGKLGRGLNISLLDAEVRKRMEGSVYCYLFKK